MGNKKEWFIYILHFIFQIPIIFTCSIISANLEIIYVSLFGYGFVCHGFLKGVCVWKHICYFPTKNL